MKNILWPLALKRKLRKDVLVMFVIYSFWGELRVFGNPQINILRHVASEDHLRMDALVSKM